MIERRAKIRADHVEVGMRLVCAPHPTYGGTYATVYASHAGKSDAGLWVLRHSRGLCVTPADQTVEVEDDSGLIQLRHDVTVYGPYVTSCTMDRERSGAVHFANVRADGPSVVACDLLIRQDDRTVVRLDNVEVNHLRDMAADLIDNARANRTAPDAPSA